MSRIPRSLALALLASLATSCGGGGSSGDAPKGDGSLDTKPVVPTPPIDHPPVDPGEAPVTSAAVQRLSVAQLRASFPVLLGVDAKGDPITWKDGTRVGFDANASALGEADFSAITEEVREPSPLYVKFMDDAARSACDQTLTADRAKATAAERTLLRRAGLEDTLASNPTAIDDNLRVLKLRFHGARLGADARAETELAPLRKLFDEAVKGAAKGAMPTEDHVAEGWRVVCVALLTAPEFHLY